MTPVVWDLEWRLSVTGRRRLVLDSLVPLLLAVPIATGVTSAVGEAAMYAVLFTTFGTFSSAIRLARDGASGIVARVVRGGVSPSGYLLQRSAASAVLRSLQLAPALTVTVLGAGASPLEVLIAFGALGLTTWVCVLIGALAAAMSRSLGEAALFAGLSTLLVLHISGVFRTPLPGSYALRFEAASPFRALHESILDLALTAPAAGAGGGALAVWALLLPVVIGVLAPSLTRSLGSVGRG